MIGNHGQVVQRHASVAESGPHLERAEPEGGDISILRIGLVERIIPPCPNVRSDDDKTDQRKENVVLDRQLACQRTIERRWRSDSLPGRAKTESAGIGIRHHPVHRALPSSGRESDCSCRRLLANQLAIALRERATVKLTRVKGNVINRSDLADPVRRLRHSSSLRDRSVYGQVPFQLVPRFREGLDEQSLPQSQRSRESTKVFVLGCLVDRHRPRHISSVHRRRQRHVAGTGDRSTFGHGPLQPAAATRTDDSRIPRTSDSARSGKVAVARRMRVHSRGIPSTGVSSPRRIIDPVERDRLRSRKLVFHRCGWKRMRMYRRLGTTTQEVRFR